MKNLSPPLAEGIEKEKSVYRLFWRTAAAHHWGSKAFKPLVWKNNFAFGYMGLFCFPLKYYS